MINFKQHVLIFSALLITACFSDKTQEVNENDVSSSSLEYIISSSSEANDLYSSSSLVSIGYSSSGTSSSSSILSSVAYSSSSPFTSQIDSILFDSCIALGESPKPFIGNTLNPNFSYCYDGIASKYLTSIEDSLSKNNTCENINDCNVIHAQCLSFGFSESQADSLTLQHVADSLSNWRMQFFPGTGCDPMNRLEVKSCTNSVCVYGWHN